MFRVLNTKQLQTILKQIERNYPDVELLMQYSIHPHLSIQFVSSDSRIVGQMRCRSANGFAYWELQLFGSYITINIDENGIGSYNGRAFK